MTFWEAKKSYYTLIYLKKWNISISILKMIFLSLIQQSTVLNDAQMQMGQGHSLNYIIPVWLTYSITWTKNCHKNLFKLKFYERFISDMYGTDQ